MKYQKLSGVGVYLFFSIKFCERIFKMTCRCCCRQKVRLVSSWSSSLLSQNYKYNVHGTLVSSYQQFRSACRTFFLNWRCFEEYLMKNSHHLVFGIWWRQNNCRKILYWDGYSVHGGGSYVVVSFYLCFSYYLFITSKPLTVDTFLEVLSLSPLGGQQTFLLVLPEKKLSDISSWLVVKKG